MNDKGKPGRRERNKERNKREILEAAMHVFSERGFHDASIQDIAARAEFAVGTIYALYDTKEDLYRALLLQHAQEATAKFTEALEHGEDEHAQLWNYVQAKGRLFEHKMKLARLIFTETLGTGISFKAGPNPELKSMYDTWHRRLAQIFAAGMEHGVFRKANPLSLALALEGMTNQFLYQSQEDPEGFTYDMALETIRDVFFRSIVLDPRAIGGATHPVTTRQHRGAPGRG